MGTAEQVNMGILVTCHVQDNHISSSLQHTMESRKIEPTIRADTMPQSLLLLFGATSKCAVIPFWAGPRVINVSKRMKSIAAVGQ